MITPHENDNWIGVTMLLLEVGFGRVLQKSENQFAVVGFFAELSNRDRLSLLVLQAYWNQAVVGLPDPLSEQDILSLNQIFNHYNVPIMVSDAGLLSELKSVWGA